MCLAIALLSACGGRTGAEGPDGPLVIDAAPDAAVPLTPCPSSGMGAVVPVAGSTCVTITPAESGAASTGENALVPSYALTAGTTNAPRGVLLVFFNGSGGHPGGPIADPNINFYNAAAALGYDVLALSYASDASVGSLCAGVDACFFPTRETLIFGVPRPGASTGVAALTLDEGIADRLVLALRALAMRDPAHRWATYLAGTSGTPETQIAWSRLAVAGHSQGGGHAAAIGKLFPVARVIQLAATCDAPGGTPASWTAGTAGTWATDPTRFYGLGAPTSFDASGQPTGGDQICAYHLATWRHLGMIASRQHDDAATCGATTAQGFHGAAVRCVANDAVWRELLR